MRVPWNRYYLIGFLVNTAGGTAHGSATVNVAPLNPDISYATIREQAVNAIKGIKPGGISIVFSTRISKTDYHGITEQDSWFTYTGKVK